jgi:hypothetical protein
MRSPRCVGVREAGQGIEAQQLGIRRRRQPESVGAFADEVGFAGRRALLDANSPKPRAIAWSEPRCRRPAPFDARACAKRLETQAAVERDVRRSFSGLSVHWKAERSMQRLDEAGWANEVDAVRRDAREPFLLLTPCGRGLDLSAAVGGHEERLPEQARLDRDLGVASRPPRRRRRGRAGCGGAARSVRCARGLDDLPPRNNHR